MKNLASAVTGICFGLLAMLIFLLIKLVSAALCRLSLLLSATRAANMLREDNDDDNYPSLRALPGV